ncbi:MAG: JmjC domain-containing protein [Burkholderiales bacterium]
MELSPQARQLRDFYYKTALKLPPEKDFVHGQRVVDRPSLFTIESLRTHLNNPLLRPEYFRLYWKGKEVDCAPAMGHKLIQGSQVPLFNKGILEQYLANGAAVVLEAIDLFDPMINAICGAIESAGQYLFVNSVAFFSQAAGGEAYSGHVDTADVLVLQLAGRKKWFIHERQHPRWVDTSELDAAARGPVQAEIVMEPGDALFMRSYTPHLVETADDYSLHLAFDICDRRINADTSLDMLLHYYNRDAAAPYAPTAVVLEKLASHMNSSAYRDELESLLTRNGESYKLARTMFGTNRINALDRWIASEATRKR